MNLNEKSRQIKTAGWLIIIMKANTEEVVKRQHYFVHGAMRIRAICLVHYDSVPSLGTMWY